ncbi:MAG: hypothetical protein ACI9XR_002541 [Flavobacterium sp.]|jgi:hypothetical protein
MKHFFRICILLLTGSIQSQQNTNSTQLLSSQVYSDFKVEDSNITKTHLNLIFAALLDKKTFTRNTINILNNYQVLKEYSLKKGSYTFQVTDKSGFNDNSTNNIIFWRMDVTDQKAHYEFFLSETNKQAIKYSFHLDLINGKWEIQKR